MTEQKNEPTISYRDIVELSTLLLEKEAVIKALVEAIQSIIDEVETDHLSLSTFARYNAKEVLALAERRNK